MEYKSWEEFINTYNTSDHDLNHCFRFDLIEEEEGFVLYLFYILQRKGDFLPVRVANIQEKDLREVEKYLQSCWDYLKKQWEEFSVHD